MLLALAYLPSHVAVFASRDELLTFIFYCSVGFLR